METSGKVALITGAARRVGRAIAVELARAGCDIAIHYHRSEGDAQSLADEIRKLGRRVTLVSGDLAHINTPAALVAHTRAELGRLDILVNNASTFDKKPFEETEGTFWEQTLRANLIAPALLARAAAEIMRGSGGGRIINMADIMADRPAKGYAAYCTSKAAIAGLTRCLAIELAPDITVNAIAPGIAIFPEDYDEATKEKLVSRVPLKRPGSPEEVAALARFLIEQGDYITGQVIPLDGGRSIKP